MMFQHFSAPHYSKCASFEFRFLLEVSLFDNWDETEKDEQYIFFREAVS